MTTTINASPTNGLVQTADGSGVLKVQSNGKTTNALAWVNFDGTGTVAIRSSYNVSSITDNGTGDYTVNFTNAMSDANYCAVTSCMYSVGSTNFVSTNFHSSAGYTTSSVRLLSGQTNTSYDMAIVNMAVFGN